jgi:hypothetical protein
MRIMVDVIFVVAMEGVDWRSLPRGPPDPELEKETLPVED